MDLPFEIELYTNAKSIWPPEGRHIIGSYTDNSIVVFQAYKPGIANWVVENQTFRNCPGYSMDRMTWIKPNFLWMMYRSGWATKENQERILAISVKREGFDQLLVRCKRNGRGSSEDDVRLQWDPDHDPYGEKETRRAIQLGVRGATLQKYVDEWIMSIQDITDFVQQQYSFVLNKDLSLLQVPVQRVYLPNDDELKVHLGLDKIEKLY